MNVRQAAAEGQEVFLTYGALSNAQLLSFYGFALDRNPHNYVNVTGALVRAVCALGGAGGGGREPPRVRGPQPRRTLAAQTAWRQHRRDRHGAPPRATTRMDCNASDHARLGIWEGSKGNATT